MKRNISNAIVSLPISDIKGLEGVVSYIPSREMTHCEIIDEFLGGQDGVRKNSFNSSQIQILKRRAQRRAKVGDWEAKLVEGVDNLFYSTNKAGNIFCTVMYYEEGRFVDTNERGQTVSGPDNKWLKIRFKVEEKEKGTLLSRHIRVFRNTILGR